VGDLVDDLREDSKIQPLRSRPPIGELYDRDVEWIESEKDKESRPKNVRGPLICSGDTPHHETDQKSPRQ
jgi:hypothetical protein